MTLARSLALIALVLATACACILVASFIDWMANHESHWRDTRAHHNAIDFGHRYDGEGMTQWGCNRQSEGKYHCEGYMIVPRKDEPMNFSWIRASWDCDDVGCILKESL